MTLEVRLLGTFHVKSGTKIVVLTSRSAQSLFAFLILHAGTSFRREKLAGLVWPETTEENARDYLRHALWRIRKSLQEASSSNHLKADDLAVAFDATSDYWLDVNAIQEADESGPPEDLMEVLAAYNGEFLPGFYEEWVATEREQVQAVYERKMASLLDLLEAGRRWSEVLEWGERWIANGQKPEAAYRHLMTAHAAKGDMAKAAAAYERCQKALAEYGMEPSEQTVGLLREIKAGQHTIQPTRLSVRPAGSRPVSRIPIPLTGFIGREKELAEIARLLGGTRLLTLLGPGGVGKTRLAIETAGKLERAFRDGVCWVDLVGLSDRELVPQAVRRAAGAPDLPGQDSIGTLTEHFAHRQCLLILDNCEHLISACAQMAAQLLAGSRQLKILATSREALDILGETTWTVPSLSLPTGEEVSLQLLPGFESVHLLLERIADARPGFELTEQNAPAVVHICNRLSGIPLALELAAARSRMMSVEEIASRLQESFDILTAGNRFALPRHQTLRATIDWSHQLLTAQEQILFRRLAIFAGGFTLEAAEEIAADETLPKAQILNALGHLIAKSMVSMQSGASGSPTRYFMLETIRQFAREQLDRTEGQDALRERHLEYFASFASRAGIKMMGSASVEVWQSVAADVENLRLALNWPFRALATETAQQHRAIDNQYLIIGALGDFWESRFRTEILQVFVAIVECDNERRPTRERASALSSAGFMEWSLHHFAEARRYLEESLAIAEQIGDQLMVAWALSHLGWNADFVGDYDAAQALGQRSLAIGRSLGDQGRYVVGQSLSFLGDIPYSRGDLLEARRLYEEAVVFLRDIKEVNRLTYPVRRLGYVSLHEGNISAALDCFSESLELNRQVGHLLGMVACIAGLAASHLEAGNLETSATLYTWVEAQLRRIGAPFFFIDTAEYQRGLLRLKQAIGPANLEQASAQARELALEDAIQLGQAR